MCRQEGAKATAGKKDWDTWQCGFPELCRSVLKNRASVENVYRSVQRETVWNCVYGIMYDLLADIVMEISAQYNVPPEEQRWITVFINTPRQVCCRTG